MDGRNVAWIGYVPIPLLFLVPALAAGRDRLARYHAWQSGALVVATYAALMLLGVVNLSIPDGGLKTTIGFLAGLVILAAFVQMAWGGIGAALGRYPRLRPAWDLARLVRRAG